MIWTLLTVLGWWCVLSGTLLFLWIVAHELGYALRRRRIRRRADARCGVLYESRRLP